MKILLLGECSNLHWTLAEGLRAIGHDVTVASDGSKWMANKRDIDLTRSSYGLTGTIRYTYQLLKNINQFRGFDIVQIKNPLFVDLKADKNLLIYKFLKKYNKKVFLGAFGTDYYWIKACLDKQMFRYSDYFIGDQPTNIPLADQLAKEWFDKPKKYLNEYIADSCDGIIACLYEYYAAYEKMYPDKLTYISEPVNISSLKFRQKGVSDRKIRFFIGIQTDRHQLKGTNLLLKCINQMQERYKNDVDIRKAESVPNSKYLSMLSESDIILDQIYSYTPGMNALSAMALGLVAVSGAEPELYELLKEAENKPIINVLPNEQDIFDKLEQIVLNKEQIATHSLSSRQFIEKHHDSILIAQKYIDFWGK